MGGTVIRLFRILALSLVAALAGAGPAFAVDYPVHPVKWIVPYPPGGTTDVLARIMAQWLSEKMGQENRRTGRLRCRCVATAWPGK
jgi:tripartite-type tricarboxylate transporter receptor subunit TctC